MLAIIPSQIEKAPAAYRKAALDYRKVNPNSAEAAAFEYVATDLEERIQQARDAEKKLKIPVYAKRCGVNTATVRKWIYRGELDATKNDAGDWEIPATAQRVRKPRQKASA